MTWLGVTMILLMILLTNQFARILGDVAKGKLLVQRFFAKLHLERPFELTPNPNLNQNRRVFSAKCL